MKSAKTPETDLPLATVEDPANAMMVAGPVTTQGMLDVIRRAATDPNCDVDKMERLLAMAERLDAKRAEQEFNSAMRDCQKEMPVVQRDAVNPSTGSRYARLETIQRFCGPIIEKHGFSLSYGTEPCTVPDHYTVTCLVSHTGGHSRLVPATLPADYMGPKGQQNKTKTHGFGSSLSYGQRYLLKLIFNIQVPGEDRDGNQRQQQQPGPSTMQPKTTADPVREMAVKVWELMKKRKPELVTQANWNAANAYFWREELLDGAIPETAPNLPLAKFQKLYEGLVKLLA